MTNSMTYKGYSASIAYDDDDGLFTGRIAGIRDGVGFHADTVEALRAAFQEAVDDYFETCAKIGKGPLADYVMSDADTILTTRATELEAIDDTIMCEVAGVAQAADDVRKALDALDGLLGDR
jgi:predicted RNase H-like HicB family nuclease